MSNKAMLVILDGWGLGERQEADAIQAATTPFVDSLYKKYPNSTLVTFGEEVGLPEGQMGNSEVGHINIGAGRVVYQELARINKAIREKTLHTNSTLVDALAYAKQNNKPVHLMGLLSDGGVHSHINHLKALCDICEDHQLEKVFIHAFTDGRDTAPDGGKKYLADLSNYIESKSAKIASVVGRYYAMDRDTRWERTKMAYDLLVNGTGEFTQNLQETIQERYDNGEKDEFIKPIICEKGATIHADDVVLFFNFRTDRPRQITSVLTQQDYPDHNMKKISLRYLTMTRYDENFKNVDVLFKKDDINNTLGQILANNNKTQVRIAETEKYPHVTFFFNGGKEDPFEGERRIMIPSPKVATYDLQPEMSALEITNAIVSDIHENQPDFICLNYANTDMVGHTGVFEAAVRAAQTVDICLERLVNNALQHDYHIIIIADHGNADIMMNEDGSLHTAHTTNLVPCIYVSNNKTNSVLKKGKLADLAPTFLDIMGIAIPAEMTGDVLIG